MTAWIAIIPFVPLDLYERIQELMEARTMHHNEVPFNAKWKTRQRSPKWETCIYHACHYKIHHPQDCDGQTGYSGEKLDGIIDKIFIQLFERMKTVPRSHLIEKVNIEKNFENEVEFKIIITQFFDFLHPEGDKSVYYRAS